MYSRWDSCRVSLIIFRCNQLKNILRVDRGFKTFILFKIDVKKESHVEKKNVHLINSMIRMS